MTILEPDPRRKVLVVTLLRRNYRRAQRSWRRAFDYWLKVDPAARFDHLVVYGKDPHGWRGGHGIVVWKYQQAQLTFRAGDWGVFIAVEDDMILPHDTFPRLLKVLDGGADVAYGLYIYRCTQKWSAATYIDRQTFRSLSQRPGRARTYFGEVVDCKGIGLGCAAIKRHVLEELTFRKGGTQCNDWWLALDAKERGFVQRCDTGLVCGHIDHGLIPSVLWPDVDKPELYRRERLWRPGY